MDLRYACDTDREAIVQLWRRCFPQDTDRDVAITFDCLYRPENTLLLLSGGEIASMLQVLPMDFSYHGKTVLGGYVFGVATAPEQRMHGYMRILMAAAIEAMRRRGMALLTLIPAVTGFYEKFGFKTHFFKGERIVKREAVRQGGCANEAGLSQLKPLYESGRTQWELSPSRSDTFWEAIRRNYLEPEDCGALLMEDGYAVYAYRDKAVFVREMLAKNRQVEEGLLAALFCRYPDARVAHIADVHAGVPHAMLLSLTECVFEGSGYMNLMLDI